MTNECLEDESETLLDSGYTNPGTSDAETKFMYLSCVVVSFGFFTLGYDIGVISGSMVFITEYFSLTFLWHELLVSLAIGPAVLGAFFAGYSNEIIGRKLTLLLSAVVFIFGALVMAFAVSKDVFLLGRVLTGVAFGFTSLTSNMYIAEFAPARIRGKLTCFGSLSVTGSLFVGAFVSGIFSGDKITGWRYMLGLGAVPAFILFVGLFWVPESPRWLISKGHFKDATEVLQKLRGIDDVQEEIIEIKRRHDLAKKEGSTWSTLFRMFTVPSTRRALLIACSLMAIQQLTGINTILYYAATIIEMSGVTDESTAVWLSAAVAFVNFIFTFVTLFTVEHFGRRKVVLTSIMGVFLSLVLLSITFYMQARTSPLVDTSLQRHLPNECVMTSCDKCLYNEMCGFCYINEGNSIRNATCVLLDSFSTTSSRYCGTDFELIRYYGCPSSVVINSLAVVGLVLYIVCFAPGLGPVPFVVTAEIFPLWARSAGMACSMATGFFFNVVISMTFLHSSRLFTKAGWFGLSGGCAILGWIFIYVLLPETKGRRLEHMEDLLPKF